MKLQKNNQVCCPLCGSFKNIAIREFLHGVTEINCPNDGKIRFWVAQKFKPVLDHIENCQCSAVYINNIE